MKRHGLFLFAIMFILLFALVQEVFTMPATVKHKVFLPGVEAEFKKLFGRKIIVGPAAAEGSELAKYAAANEFGATITPKNAAYLALPLSKEAKERRPRDFDLVPVFPKGGTPYLAMKQGNSLKPYYLLLKKVTIPERSFLRSAFDKKATVDKAMTMARGMMQRLLGGSATAEDVLNAIGSSLASSVKENIASNIGPGNAPLTLALKRGKGTTLVDEAQLLKSISYEVI
ncbi:MAG TPA: hypothetical protein PKY31_00810 [Spirochaetota bacterium]|nr:hypothetical protein [Spirochaetota bacterium]